LSIQSRYEGERRGAVYKSPVAKLVAAKDGTTFSGALQPVPGGLDNALVNSQIGLPSEAGQNSVVLKGTLITSPTVSVKANDEKVP
jgi:hypothetical protein